MAEDQQQPTDASGERDVRQHEEEARRRRTDAERDRAASEREAEETGAPRADEPSVLPEDADEERRGVMRPRSE